MIDHLGLNVRDAQRSKAFYIKALEPLGYGLVREYPGAIAFGPAGRPVFWLVERPEASTGTHVAFAAQQRAEVDAFHRAALAAGGSENGAPGLRPQYHQEYYGAFVKDPDGHNVEAVCHTPA